MKCTAFVTRTYSQPGQCQARNSIKPVTKNGKKVYYCSVHRRRFSDILAGEKK